MVSALAWLSRYLYTAAQSLTLVAQLLGPDAVLSHAGGIGVIWRQLVVQEPVCE